MIISSQDIAMSSKRKYTQTTWVQQTKTSEMVTGNVSDIFSKLMENYSNESQKVEQTTEPLEVKEPSARVKFETLNYLLRIFFRFRGQGYQSDFQKQLQEMRGANLENQLSFRVAKNEFFMSYEEVESVDFSTKGYVNTADGRTISFDINVGMSRSFYQEYYESSVGIEQAFCDPLVINLDSDTAHISDQTFFFDLDADGKEEEISQLGYGSGFLALDKNGDGKINDGNELFGTKSGDGFSDLSVYDLDRNGWIDEADEIFDQLRIWTFGEDGESECYTLREKGIGAICLSKVDTQFTEANSQNQALAKVRSTGIFLMEDGRAKTMQHVDMAI